MRSKNVFWGVILVSLGILFVLRNMGVICFGWYSVFNLWPVLLVVLGISLLPIKIVVRIVLAFLVIVLSLIFISNTGSYDHNHFQPHNWFWDHDEYSYHNNDEESYYEEDYEWRDQTIFETYDDDIENAVFELEAIAGKFNLSETTDYLLKFDREGNFGKYYMRADNAGSAVVLKIDMDSRIEKGNNLKNKAEISLHPDPVWSIKVDAGAAMIDFDLRPFKIDRVDIDGGASAIEIQLGGKYENTDVQINSGAASITIRVPESAGCEVLTNTVLSSKILDGFDKIENGVYRTDNFDDEVQRISISIDAAISSLKVVRY